MIHDGVLGERTVCIVRAIGLNRNGTLYVSLFDNIMASMGLGLVQDLYAKFVHMLILRIS